MRAAAGILGGTLIATITIISITTAISIIIIIITIIIIIIIVISMIITITMALWLRTNGVNPNGAAAGAMNLDRFEKKVRKINTI